MGDIIVLLTDRGRRALFAGFLNLRALVSPVAFGVTGAVFDDEGWVLLVKQTYMPGWRLPGGAIGRGEHPDSAVMRELAEEVGLSGGAASLFGFYAGRSGLVTHLVALYRVTGATIAFRPNWEVRDILFADPAAPPPDTAAATLRRLKELSGAEKRSQVW
jgi:ADP-ribose pyrophosphatase YjhB (NUDIX family)